MVVLLSSLFLLIGIAVTDAHPVANNNSEEYQHDGGKIPDMEDWNKQRISEVTYKVSLFEKLIGVHGYQADEINAFYADDVFFQILGDSPATDKERLTTIFEHACENVDRFLHNISVIHIYNDGKSTIESGTFTISYKNEREASIGRYFRIWEKRQDELVIVREIVLLEKDTWDKQLVEFFNFLKSQYI